jgi:hypothetical protein
VVGCRCASALQEVACWGACVRVQSPRHIARHTNFSWPGVEVWFAMFCFVGFLACLLVECVSTEGTHALAWSITRRIDTGFAFDPNYAVTHVVRGLCVFLCILCNALLCISRLAGRELYQHALLQNSTLPMIL